ncbi:MAG TPA: hypothetical protein VKV79_04665 [Terriglobia bacterium]|nr:hypothetical protein [Terriglobia bacterium]
MKIPGTLFGRTGLFFAGGWGTAGNASRNALEQISENCARRNNNYDRDD